MAPCGIYHKVNVLVRLKKDDWRIHPNWAFSLLTQWWTIEGDERWMCEVVSVLLGSDESYNYYWQIITKYNIYCMIHV